MKRRSGLSRPAIRVLLILLLIWFSGTAMAGEPLAAAIAQRIEALPTRGPTAAADAATAAFYTRRDFAPAWESATRRERLAAALDDLRSDGLDPDDYRIAEAAADDAVSLAARDVAITRRLLLALQHLHEGRVDPFTLDPQWNVPRDRFDGPGSAQALEAALASDAYLALFETARPSHWLYGRLRLALQRLHAIAAAGGWPILPKGPSLRPGDRSEITLLLRERLRISGEGLALDVSGAGDPQIYDADLEAALRRFQTAQYLESDGVLGRATREALNVPVSARIAQMRVNLERARWLLSRSQPRFVLVDLAGYRALYFRDREVVWRGRVQVGRPYRRTPVFEAKITYLTLNPTWTVPPTILREDILPKLRSDPGYLDRQHLRVVDRQGRELPRDAVDLGRVGNWYLRQDAGPENALGRVAIRFPNPYSVYMHDTPSQALFDEHQRAFSSGCIRVERAPELARLLLDDETQWNAAAFDAAIAAGETRNVSLREPVPLLIAYWTVDVGPDGQFAFRPDIYDRDAAVLEALEVPLPAAGFDG